MSEAKKLRRPCGNMLMDHEWEQVGSHWVPVPAAYTFPTPMPLDYEVEYLDFECRRCPAKHSEERLYSRRPRRSATVESR